MMTRSTSGCWTRKSAPIPLCTAARSSTAGPGVVGEVAGEQVGDPEADRRMQHAKHGDVTGWRVKRCISLPLQCCSVSHRVRDEGAPPAQIQLRCNAVERDAQVPVKNVLPTVMVAAHERDRNAAGADSCACDRGKVFAGMTLWYSNQKSKRSPVSTRWSPGLGTSSRKAWKAVPTAAGTDQGARPPRR